MKKEIEKRLIDLAIAINDDCKMLDRTYLSEHITTQIIRSSTSAALNYGEAQAAESRRDFIHKLSIVLKELKETKISLKLLGNQSSKEKPELFLLCAKECDELVAIFHKTIQTAKKNM